MLQMQDLTKSYGDVKALDGCTFGVGPGQMLGFLGPNGSGKTTTMRAIFGLIKLDRGSVTLDGKPISAQDRLAFGYMPEQRGLYPKMKAADQLAYLGALHGMEPAEARRAGMELLDDLGLSDRANDPVEELSFGNQQRVQLAAALVHDPSVLVLDEPFNGLDPIGAETMAEVLRLRAEAGATVIFSSHQLDMVEDLCEEVAVINEGRIVMEGNVRQLKAASPHRVIEFESSNGHAAVLDQLDGVVTSSFDGHRYTVIVPSDLDVRQVLNRADSDSGIQHISYSTPSLSQLFKEAVS
jgi:ABC-2 type transport system ATP-binding protein